DWNANRLPLPLGVGRGEGPRALLFAVLLVAGCGGDGTMGTVMMEAPPKFSSAQPLTLQPVDWNPNKTDLGKVAAITELEGDVIGYGDKGVNVRSGGAVSATDASITTWTTAATIPAADGTGDWAVGVDNMGHLFRLRARMSIEEATDRYGLAGVQVTGL